MLTPEQKKRYIEGGGDFCPFCESDDIEWDMKDILDSEIVQDGHCNACGKYWQDVYVYTLTDVDDKSN